MGQTKPLGCSLTRHLAHDAILHQIKLLYNARYEWQKSRTDRRVVLVILFSLIAK